MTATAIERAPAPAALEESPPRTLRQRIFIDASRENETPISRAFAKALWTQALAAGGAL
ncbi:hypothetical protein HY251_20670, partial [bacterium]|nr:hypothetical protein [bacterium]